MAIKCVNVTESKDVCITELAGYVEMKEITSAGFLQVNKLLREVHDVGILFLTHVCQEMQEGLLLICRLGISELQKKKRRQH